MEDSVKGASVAKLWLLSCFCNSRLAGISFNSDILARNGKRKRDMEAVCFSGKKNIAIFETFLQHLLHPAEVFVLKYVYAGRP